VAPGKRLPSLATTLTKTSPHLSCGAGGPLWSLTGVPNGVIGVMAIPHRLAPTDGEEKRCSTGSVVPQAEFPYLLCCRGAQEP
jgi:hypothetical protein